MQRWNALFTFEKELPNDYKDKLENTRILGMIFKNLIIVFSV
jgi:hypothetical protein